LATADHGGVDPEYLWNFDAVYLEAMRICVYGPNAEVLRCVGEDAMPDTTHSLAGGGRCSWLRATALRAGWCAPNNPARSR
jgi:hypothetical protein